MIEKEISADQNSLFDTQAGLEWFVGPDEDTTHEEAEKWVKRLSVDGGGWRMPTPKELRGLYKEGKESRHLSFVYKASGWQVWAKCPSLPDAYLVDLSGRDMSCGSAKAPRVFAVRLIK